MKRAYILSSLIFLLTSILIGCIGRNQNSEKVPEENVKKKPKIEIVEGFLIDKVDLHGNISYQWKQSDSLYRNAPTKELVSMASTSKEPVKRLISFRALLWKDPHEAVNLIISEIDDSTIVYISTYGCGTEDRVSNVRIFMVQSNREGYNVTENDSMRIDSALLYSDNAPLYDYTYGLYKELPVKPVYEARLRQLYKRDIRALVALARFHQNEEKQAIINLLSQANNKDTWEFRDTTRVTLLAVAVWPNKSFKPSVQKICENIFFSSQKSYGCEEQAFSALIAYDEQWSYKMIERALSKPKEFDTRLCFEYAYENNPLPRFKPLYQKYKSK
ncbi:MAG: hypothetical protein IKZ61_06835 [Prevotella sp.]|nr:hypothetical protein [Prevotella sp.]